MSVKERHFSDNLIYFHKLSYIFITKPLTDLSCGCIIELRDIIISVCNFYNFEFHNFYKFENSAVIFTIIRKKCVFILLIAK